MCFRSVKGAFFKSKEDGTISFDAQRKMVEASMAIHNFLCKILVDGPLFAQYDNDEVELDSVHGHQNQTAQC